MIGIILSLFLAFILVTRSIESVVTDKETLEKIDNFHHKATTYIRSVINTTFDTASIGILADSLKYVIWFFCGMYMITLLISGIAINAGSTNTAFISKELSFISVIAFVPMLLGLGLKTNFITFYKRTKRTILESIKTPLVIIILVLYYLIIFIFYYTSFVILKNANVSNELNFIKIIGNKATLLLFLFPILGVVIFVLIEFLIWAVCRLSAYFSYHILKYIFKKSEKLSGEKPLKPLLLIIQTITLIIPPIIVYIKELIS